MRWEAEKREGLGVVKKGEKRNGAEMGWGGKRDKNLLVIDDNFVEDGAKMELF